MPTPEATRAPSERLPFAPEPSSASAHLPEGPPSRAWRRFDRLVLGVTLAGLVLPSLLLLAGVRPHPIENRPLLRFPRAALATVLDGTWFRAVDAYIADNIELRPYAIRVRGEVIALSGGTGNPQVIRGLNGWLFTRGEIQPTCEFSADAVLSALDAAAAKLASKGVGFRFVGVPDKHAIYPEEVGPDPFPTPCTDTQLPSLRAGLSALGPVAIDGWAALTAARTADPEGLLYYHGDTHWTPLGATQAIRALILSIEPTLWNGSTVEVHGTSQRTVDLELQLGLRRQETVPHVVIRPGMKVTRTDVAVDVAIHNARSIFTTTAVGAQPTVAGRTLILYDSFFGIDVGLVAPFFADATWVHVGDMENHPELATMLGPFDTVIVERVERGIYLSDFGKMLSGAAR